MKKSGLTLLVVLLATIAIHAQLRVAIAGGAHTSTVLETNDLTGWDSISNNYSSRTGFHLGFVGDLRFSRKSIFYLQPGVSFYNKGRKYTAPFDSTGTIKAFSSSQYVNYMDLPFNIVMKFSLGKKAKFVLGGGPYASFFFNGKETTETLYDNGSYKNTEKSDLPVGTKVGQYKTFDYGVNALAGFELGHVFLTANYSRGFGDFYTPAYDGHLNHQVIGGTLGIYIGRTEYGETKQKEKIRDKDKDGISDDKDECPTEAGTAATNGCPDKDGDGIADKSDQCPKEPGTLANHGCPVRDKDNDGVADEADKCPTVAGSKKYNGCPVPDSDKDGINDEEDKCPAEAGVARYGGCPIPDSDKDGLNDEEDKCPTVAGTKQNNGCPVIKKEIIEKVNFAARRIQFEEGKATLLPASQKVLDEVAKILGQNQDLKISVEGHTSNNANYEDNMKLSRDRANRVKDYLVKKGIDPDRLHAIGFGPNKPLNKGKTPAEQAQNRRVELKLSNQ